MDRETEERIIDIFEKADAPLSVEDLLEEFPDIDADEMEEMLDYLWEKDILCRMESFCSILYTLE